ncbi:MAG: LysO family transporter [Tannerella sp.]|jgi:Na+/H+-dicarboxylate symporter|nr:LysO family transporter [Tannerella sp.]
MFIVIAIMFAGIAVGYFFRRWERLKNINFLIIIIICLMLFLLGVSIGSNKLIVKNIGTLGWQAFIIGTAATLGSILAGWGLYRWLFKKREK